jgi:hypothetical protein
MRQNPLKPIYSSWAFVTAFLHSLGRPVELVKQFDLSLQIRFIKSCQLKPMSAYQLLVNWVPQQVQSLERPETVFHVHHAAMGRDFAQIGAIEVQQRQHQSIWLLDQDVGQVDVHRAE